MLSNDLFEQLGLAGKNAGPGTAPGPGDRVPSPSSEGFGRTVQQGQQGQQQGPPAQDPRGTNQLGGGSPFPTPDQVAAIPPTPLPAFGKIAQPDATYCDPGPAPFVCGVCIFYLSGVGEAGGSVSGQGTCQLVDGEIGEGASCRFFRARPPVAGMVVPASEPPGPLPPPDQPRASQSEAGGTEGYPDGYSDQTENSVSSDSTDTQASGDSGWGDHGLIEGE